MQYLMQNLMQNLMQYLTQNLMQNLMQNHGMCSGLIDLVFISKNCPVVCVDLNTVF